jgi:alkaline phosphatase
MTAKALGILKADRKGFFLFVEEEGIDEFEHRNNTPKTILAGQSLDRAVAVAVRFAATHPGTLLVVAGDHATGGLAIENVDETDESGDDVSAEDGPFTVAGSDLQFVVDWTTGGHTGESTPLTAEGPGARALARVQKNTDVHDAILTAMRLRQG